jgi:hypothetical protein
MNKITFLVALLALFIAVSSLTINLINYKELTEKNDHIVEYPVSDMTITCYNTKTNKIVDCED